VYFVLSCSLYIKPSLGTFLNYLSSQTELSLLYVNLAYFQINLASLLIFPILSQKPRFTLLIFTKPNLVSRLHTPHPIHTLYVINFSFFIFSGLEFELRTSGLQSRHSTSSAVLLVYFALVILGMGISRIICPGCLELQSS
jgi:hypothetical protein